MEKKKKQRAIYPDELWEKMRIMWEAGATYTELGRLHGMSVGTVFNHAKRNKWERNDCPENRLRAAVLKYDLEARSGPSPADANDQSGAIVSKHQQETEMVRSVLYNGLRRHAEAETMSDKRNAFEDLKAAKISSECLLNIHQAERRAWRIDAADIKRNITIVRDFENKETSPNANNSS